MSAEYSVDEVLESARKAAASNGRAKEASMLFAYAERIKADEEAVRDPHHNGDCEWRWDGERLYQRVTGQSKWVECKRIHVTKARIKAIHSILFPRPTAQAVQVEAPPHCKGHMQFEYDCLDCSDVLERKRKASTTEQAAQVDEYAAGWRQAANWAERGDLIADIGSPAYERDKAFVLRKPTTEPVAQGEVEGDRAAYEGAREDLLDWKGRAQRAEAKLRSLGYTGVDASEPRRGIRLGLALANELASHLGPELHEYRDALRRAIAEAEVQ